jgi:uncharacterized membrane protein (UPF0127 family)
MQAINQTRGTILCARLDEAGGLGGQARGLLGRAVIEPQEGLIFARRRYEPFMLMHMFFMRFAIDLVFLDRYDRVIRICSFLKPWRLSPVVFAARKALEMAPGAVARSRTVVGDQIAFRETND